MENETIRQYNGWRYMADFDDEEDCRKIWHYAVDPEGNAHMIDWSPYRGMPFESFVHWVELGRPAPKTFGTYWLDPDILRNVRALRDRMNASNDDLPMLARLAGVK